MTAAGTTTTVSVTVGDPDLQQEARALAQALADEGFASSLAAQDTSSWWPAANPALGWTAFPVSSRPLVEQVAALRTELLAEGVSRVVLAGTGGATTGAEAICRSAGVDLVVLDTTDPAELADALSGDLNRTVLVVVSADGSEVGTDSLRRIVTAALAANGLDPAARTVVVTAPGTPLATLAAEQGCRAVLTTDPDVGGRWAVLSAGLVPAGLAGADLAGLLDDAAELAPELARDDADNPALVLAGALGAAHARGAEKLVLTDSGTPGLADWVEQLVAGSTGRAGTGLLPVVVEDTDAPGFTDAGLDATTVGLDGRAGAVRVQGPLGAQLLLWQTAAAALGRLLGTDPFDRTTDATPSAPAEEHPPLLVEGALEVHVVGGWCGPVGSVTEALRALVAAAPPLGYLAVHAYLDRIEDASTAVLRPELARRSGLQTTFGWGPRLLGSTSRYHAEGHQNGVVLQLTGAHEQDLDVPGRPFTLGALQHAQAAGDAATLAARGRPVLRLHLTDRLVGLAQLVGAVQELR